MNKIYVTPDLELVKFSLRDVIMTSILESSLPEVIGGDDDQPIDLDNGI